MIFVVHYGEKIFLILKRNRIPVLARCVYPQAPVLLQSAYAIADIKITPELWIAVQNIRNSAKKSRVFCMVIHRHNDERTIDAMWQKP